MCLWVGGREGGGLFCGGGGGGGGGGGREGGCSVEGVRHISVAMP